MNKIYRSLIAMATASCLVFVGCKKDDDKGPEATNLDASTITATPLVGAVKLAWQTPTGANYQYVEVTYNHPGTSKLHRRLASVHADTLLVDGLKNLYGPIEFTLRPVTKLGKAGTAHKVTATAEVIPIETRVEKTKLTLSADGIWANDPESSEGPIANAIDGNTDTFYHANWSGQRKPLPGYIVIRMPEEIGGISFTWRNRHNAATDTKKVEVLLSKEFDGETFDPTQFSAQSAGTIEDMPSGAGKEVVSDAYFLSDKYTYVWFKIHETRTGNSFFAVGEITLHKCRQVSYNPETEETIVLE